MAKRKVFGRIQITVAGQLYKFELRESGLWIRKHRSRREWLVPLPHLLRLANVQTELFPPSNEPNTKPTNTNQVDESIKETAVRDLPA